MTLQQSDENTRILIIDDNRLIHEDFRKVLSPPTTPPQQDEFEAKLLGKALPHSTLPSFDLQFAAQGQDGALIVRNGMEKNAPIALAFIDIRMPPGWDGVETIEHIWSHDPRVQIAICTAYSDHTCEEIVERFRHTDQLLFIRKPFDNVEIYQIACAMVNKWNLAQQVRRQVSTLEEAVRRREKELEAADEKQREMEKQFQQAQKMEAVGRLTGGVAHDFNNLLTVVLGYVEILLKKVPPLERDVTEKLTAIQAASISAAKLTQQLLAFSRQGIVTPEVINLNEIIETNLGRMLQKIVGENVKLKINLRPNLPNILSDSGQIEQVIMNIVVNGRDAMDASGGQLLIETNLVGEPGKDQKVVLSISDTGQGMTDAVKEKIFEPFFTTKEVGKGTGLGLSTVYGIVTQHKGEISVESEVGKGTTFRIVFPVENGKTLSTKTPSTQEDLSGKETILLVEDEEPVRGLARQILTGAGYTVLEAGNGVDAYHLWQTEKPSLSLLLTDVVMPEMGGKELANQFSKAFPALPVLFMSGYTGREPLPINNNERPANFLQKPFRPNDLLRKVRALLDAY